MPNDEIDLRVAVVDEIMKEDKNIPQWIIHRTLIALADILSTNTLAIVDMNGEIVEL